MYLFCCIYPQLDIEKILAMKIFDHNSPLKALCILIILQGYIFSIPPPHDRFKNVGKNMMKGKRKEGEKRRKRGKKGGKGKQEIKNQ